MMAMSAADRKNLLDDNCDTRKETEYYKKLTPDELDEKRESLTEKLIQVSEWKDELKVVQDEFKDRIKPVESVMKGLLTEVKTKQALVTGILYEVADHEAGLMEVFDQDGEFVSSRRLKPEEKQGRLFIKKAE
jgi:flagellar motility protein MotE (MotC chaperone)